MEASDILIVLAGLVLVVNGVFQLLRRFVFLKIRCKAQVEGNILEMNIDEEKRLDKPDKVSYSLQYLYKVDGTEYSKRRSVGKRAYRSIYRDKTSGIAITVCYDPSKPKRHYVMEIKFRLLLTLGLIALGVVLLNFPYYNGLL